MEFLCCSTCWFPYTYYTGISQNTEFHPVFWLLVFLCNKLSYRIGRCFVYRKRHHKHFVNHFVVKIIRLLPACNYMVRRGMPMMWTMTWVLVQSNHGRRADTDNVLTRLLVPAVTGPACLEISDRATAKCMPIRNYESKILPRAAQLRSRVVTGLYKDTVKFFLLHLTFNLRLGCLFIGYLFTPFSIIAVL